MSPKEKTVTNEVRSEAAPSVTTPVAPVGPQMSNLEPPVPFDKWFKVRSKERGYRPHWMAGMQAYTDTNVPRPMTEWDNLFRNY